MLETSHNIVLRPPTLNEMVGNNKLKERLKIAVSVSKLQNRALGHILLQGNSGCGKSTIAKALGNELDCNIIEINAATVKTNKDILDVFPSITAGDILFIDEIHTLKRKHEELLYPIMEDFKIRFIWREEGQYKCGQMIDIDLPPFTLIGATTDAGNLSEPLYKRFKHHCYVTLYTDEEIKRIVLNSCQKLNLKMADDAAQELANRAKRTPRVANAILEWVRDYCVYKNKLSIDLDVVKEAMDMYEIDENGFDKNDLQYLAAVKEMQPIGLMSIAARTSLSHETIVKFIEPYLLNKGIIQITKEGRSMANFGYKDLNSDEVSDIFS